MHYLINKDNLNISLRDLINITIIYHHCISDLLYILHLYYSIYCHYILLYYKLFHSTLNVHTMKHSHSFHCPDFRGLIASILTPMCNQFPIQALDLENERVLLEDSKDVEAGSLSAEISLDNARYHFFLYKYTHEAEYLENIGQ